MRKEKKQVGLRSACLVCLSVCQSLGAENESAHRAVELSQALKLISDEN